MVFLLDCPAATVDGTDCVEVGTATVTRRPWSAPAGVWVAADADLGTVDHTVVAGRSVVIKLVVAGGASDDDMLFAFDSAGVVSALAILVTLPAPVVELGPIQ